MLKVKQHNESLIYTRPLRIITTRPSDAICRVHDIPIIEILYNGQRAEEYCPACQREMLKQN